MYPSNTPVILLVDDLPTNLQILGMLLEPEYRTMFAKDGAKALELAQKKKPDLILLDVMMPEMDGFEVCTRLQASPQTQDIPIVFLTARDEGEDIAQGFRLGAVDYITKPFRKEELLARVHTHLKLKRAENLLKQGLAEAQHLAHMGSWVWDIQRNTLTWSDEIYRIFGRQPEEFEATYDAFLTYVHSDDRKMVTTAVTAALAHGKLYSIDHRIVLPNGTERIVHEEGQVSFDASGNAIRMLGTVQDITEKRRLEAELRTLSRAIEESTNLVFVTDAQGRIEYVNPRFERVTGYSIEEIRGQNPRILSSGETSQHEYVTLWNKITSGDTWQGQLKNKKKNGEAYWINGMISPIKSEDGVITHFLAIQEDISEQMRAVQEAQYLVMYDRATSLLNRETFIEQMTERIHECTTYLLLDVDGIKLINDTYGHRLGDEILKRIAAILKETLALMLPASSYLLGRLGEDEFAIAAAGLCDNDGWQLAEDLRKRIENTTFTADVIRVTISIGVVALPMQGATATEILSRLDAAIFRAKGLGRNRSYLFRPEDKDLEKVHSRMRQKERIMKALDEDRFEPWFQPILDLQDRQVHHYEALARMRDETGNIVLPGAFIATAEALGLIHAIDRRMMAKVIAYQAELKRRGEDLSFAMNLSGKYFGDQELLKFLQATIDNTGATPGNLVFEITETAAISDLQHAITFINALKQMGCRFALDDFGVGFTSFVYLREMAVDFLKIDGIFIRKLHERREDQGIVKAITMVANTMRIKTIAEFVEYEETLNLLNDFGVNYAQGFFIGKPAPTPKLN